MTRNQRRRALQEHRRKMRYVALWRTPWMKHFYPRQFAACYAEIWREYEREVSDGLYP